MNNDLPVVNNIHERDKYLSAFGRKVFGVLLNHYTTGEFTRSKCHFSKNTVNRHEVSWQRRNERSSSLSGPNINFTNVNYDIDRNNFANEGNVTTSPNDLSSIFLERENTPAVPKTVELAKGTEDLDITDINTNKDITPNSSQIANSQPNFSLNMREEIVHNLTLHPAENNEVLKSKEVGWEDMLDCEILNVETCNNVDKSEKVDETNKTKNVNNVFELINRNKKPKMTKSTCIVESKKVVTNEKAKEKSIIGNNNKVTEHTSPGTKRKRKNKKNSDSTDTVTAVPKKPVKVTEQKSKPNISKRKNTKAINNWLDDVDPTHLVDGIDIQSGILIPSTTNIVAENPNDILQISLENVECQDRNKKMVQAKLVNENGAMKFSKPNDNNDLTQRFDEENSTAIEMTQNKIKAKKGKFVAPIKSQNSSKNI